MEICDVLTCHKILDGAPISHQANLYFELEWNKILKSHNFAAYKFSENSKES